MARVKIIDFLESGRENARSGRELCSILNVTIRELQCLIRRARKDGAPICAATGGKPGYYLAEDCQEMLNYCGSLYRRAGNLFATRRDCLKSMGLPEKGKKADGKPKDSIE